jgi:adenine-specific DNA-methyltransferase
MEYRKVPQQINDIVGDNVKKLAQLFPSAVKDGEVDFETLKEELGQFHSVGVEKYELNWAGKSNAKKIAREDVFGRTLKYIPEDSKDADTTENLYIEGDNLEVLKLLRQNYYGAIKMIYIDPPYNTGNDFVYNDSFEMEQQESDLAEGFIDELGEKYMVNNKSQNRFHASWLNMLYPRLKVAKDLLADNGIICISIDENEINNLKHICNEIYGEQNMLGIISNINNPKGRSDDKYVATAHEYILIYAKNEMLVQWYGFEPTDEKIVKRYNKIDEYGKKYREIDLRKTGENDLREDRPNLFYYFYYNIETGDYYPTRDEKIPSGYIKIKPVREDGKEGNWRWGIDTAVENLCFLIPKFMPTRKVWGIMEKDYLDGRSLVKPTSAWTFKDVNSER